MSIGLREVRSKIQQKTEWSRHHYVLASWSVTKSIKDFHFRRWSYYMNQVKKLRKSERLLEAQLKHRWEMERLWEQKATQSPY